MGSNQVKFAEECLQEFEETTTLNRAEIIHAFDVFRELGDTYTPQPRMLTDDGFADPEAFLPISHITANLPQLKYNPFNERICNTFAVSDDGNMSFTEFLDMVSSLSPKADPQKKIFHAFQIFDIDGDGVISRNDLYNVMDMMISTTDEDLMDERQVRTWEDCKKWIIDGVFNEANKSPVHCTVPPAGQTKPTKKKKKRSNVVSELCKATDPSFMIASAKQCLSIEDFRTCIARTPDFKRTFTFQL